MSRLAPPHSALLALSASLFRALLLIYPRAFRREFGPDMAQVFRAQCRQTRAERGAFGVLGLWLLAMGDLSITAIQEQFSQESPMSRSQFVRVAGVAALLGGGLNLLSFLTHPQGLERAAVPVSVVGMIVGMLGLHALLWRREGRLGWLGFGLVGVGLTLGFIGMAGSAVGVVYPNPAAPIINTGEHGGLVFIGAGMLLWGIVTLRVRALGRWSALPLAMSLLSLTGIVFLVPDAFAALEQSIVPHVFATSWVLLGIALLTSHTESLPVPTQAVAA
jgi:hypothetical protein